MGLTTEKITANKLLEYFSEEILKVGDEVVNCGNRRPPSFLVQDIYTKEQHLVYYKVKNSISPLKIQPKLFYSTIYGIRSNISDPTIRYTQYDTLVGEFQDNRKQDVLNIELKNPSFLKQEKNYYHEHILISLI